jgi:TolB protein
MRAVRSLTAGVVLAALAGAAMPLAAQEPVVIIGRYQPGARPGMVVVAAAGMDSVRQIVQRDLDYSDRFEAVSTAERPTTGRLNFALLKKLGSAYALELAPAPGGGVHARLHDIATGRMRQERTVTLPPQTDEAAFRMAVHQLSDEVVRWISGRPGYAASRLLFLGTDRRIYQIDSDGWGTRPVTPGGVSAFAPAWAPDGRRFAYSVLRGGRGAIVVQDLAGGGQTTVPGTANGLNFSPSFSGDGRSVAYSHAAPDGTTHIYAANVADGCCERRLTAGQFADNLTPTYSPDGRRIAFISTKPGTPQLYVMGADGTDQEALAPFDYGETGATQAPDWSPDGASVIFHRDVSRAPQIFVVDVAGQRVRQVTSGGRNTDPTWAPDGRHIAFVSDRSGARQLWVIDMETGRVRQLRTPGAVRLPAWSRRLGGSGN